jgi:hypothetical protein
MPTSGRIEPNSPEAAQKQPAVRTFDKARGPTLVEGSLDFSPVLGGPIYQLLRRSRLSGDALEHLYRRIIVISLMAWAPLFILVMLGPASSRNSFVHDIEVHVRFLIALPILVAAELIVHTRIRPVARRFVEQRLITPDDLSRFNKAIETTVRLRNSVLVEIGLLVFVYSVGLWVWNSRLALGTSTWYSTSGGRWSLTPAGYWYVFVSIPLLQFILLRWYFRLFVWFRFLWRVSRLNLHLVPTHPDRRAGLGFLGRTVYAYSPILFAQGAMLCGVVASRIFYTGAKLVSFKMQIGGFIVFFVFAILGPLLMFTPKMAAAKRKGLADYGLLAQRYVDNFEERWITAEPETTEQLLGSADIQSLADLGNSFAMVREMRPVPFGVEEITRLAVVTAAPLFPLLLTIFSPEELITRVIRVLF